VIADDLFTAAAARDAALATVEANAGTWPARALAAFADLGFGRQMTGEQIRHEVGAMVGPPHHHNAWGALIAIAVKRRLVEKTGEYRKMQDVQSHARSTPVYIVRAR
jgi:hypothetical protein